MSEAAQTLIIGDYRLAESIGGGRVSRVYRGVGPGGEVAVKLLAPDAELDDPAAAARFAHEVAALEAVCHPNVIALLDHGFDPELGPYLVMPLVAGRNLRELFAAGTVEPEVAALALREVAAGVGALHAAGLVHRDLKPENIVCDRDGRLVIVDLGLAWAEDQTRHTEEGAVVGSVPYMAPEQIESRPPTARTDLWALAVIAHEWITGERPFARSRPSEEVAAILAGRFTPLRERDLRVSAGLGAVIDGLLSRAGSGPRDGAELAAALAPFAGDRDPVEVLRDVGAASSEIGERAARELVAEARRLLDRGKPFAAASAIERAAAHRPGDPEILELAGQVGRAPARSRRPWWWWLAAGAVACAAALAGAVALTSGGDRPLEIDVAALPLTADDLPAATAPDRAALDALIVGRHRSLFPDGGGLAVTMRHRAEDVAASDDPAEHARYARALLSTTMRARGLEFLARSLERHPDSRELLRLRADAATRTGDFDGADAALTRLSELDPGDAAALRERGELRRLRGQPRAALADLERAHRLAPDDARAIGALVRLHILAGRGAAARELAERAVELQPRWVQPRLDLAAISDDAEALGHLEMALRNDPRSAPASRAMCLVATRLSDPRAAEECRRADRHYDGRDVDVILAQATLYTREGKLSLAHMELVAGTVRVPKSARLWAERADLEARMRDTRGWERSRKQACALGHRPSCAANPGGP